MKIGKALKYLSPIAMAGKALKIRELGGMGGGSDMKPVIQKMVDDGKVKTALEEGKERVATPLTGAVEPGMKKGGMVKKGYHKMPNGKMMKGKSHKSTASKRADGICVKGKTKGRMC